MSEDRNPFASLRANDSWPSIAIAVAPWELTTFIRMSGVTSLGPNVI